MKYNDSTRSGPSPQDSIVLAVSDAEGFVLAQVTPSGLWLPVVNRAPGEGVITAGYRMLREATGCLPKVRLPNPSRAISLLKDGSQLCRLNALESNLPVTEGFVWADPAKVIGVSLTDVEAK